MCAVLDYHVLLHTDGSLFDRLAVLIRHCYTQAASTLTLHYLISPHTVCNEAGMFGRHELGMGTRSVAGLALSVVLVDAHSTVMPVSMHVAVLL